MKKFWILSILLVVILAGCTLMEEEGATTQIANPASENCVQKGGRLEMRESEAGTTGYCVFEDGLECEEWAFFRGECQASSVSAVNSYESCVNAGYPIMESYPEKCTDGDGNVFVHDIANLSEQEASQLASDWITEKSQTYLFDGSNLEFKEVLTMRCPGCYEVVYGFESAHGGYGDRADMIVTQAITSHEVKVVFEGGSIISVVTDNVFDEMTGKMIK